MVTNQQIKTMLARNVAPLRGTKLRKQKLLKEKVTKEKTS